MGEIFVFGLLGIVCVSALTRPVWGVIGFYAFYLLDPAWNWRWALPTAFPYQKYIFFSLIVGFVLSGLRIDRQSKVAKIGLACLIGFIGWCFLSAEQTIDEQATAFFMSLVWKVGLVACLAVLLLSSAKYIRIFLIAAAVMQGYNAYQINLDYFQTGFSRYAYNSWGSYGVDNNGYSILTVPLLAIALAIAFTEKDKKWKFAFLGVAMLQIHQIMLMASRGSMIGALVSILIAVFFMPRSKTNKAIVGLAFLASAALAGPFVVDEFGSIFATGEERDSSAESRFYLWQAGLRITQDYPILGVGPNAARKLVPLPQYYEGGLEQSSKALHNLFFDISTGTGVPGLLMFSGFLFLPLWKCYQYRKTIDDDLKLPCLVVMAGIPGYAVASMFSSGALFESGYILPIVGYACLNVLARRQSEIAMESNSVELDDDEELEFASV